MNAPLYEEIKKYVGIRYHMPSHNGTDIDPLFSASKFDITELSFSDNLLYSSTGIIEKAEQLAAKSYKVGYSRFFTAGATSAIQSAILFLKKSSLQPLIVGECHQSVYNALEIFEVKHRCTDNLDMAALQGIQAVFVTSPDVYGVVQDIKGIRESIGDRLLIVDESHGAHYAFCSLLPPSATRYADITINSMHKTLPCYTGAAILHTNQKQLDSIIRQCRRLIHTTSPSYLVMASMDWARAYFDKNGEELYKDIHDKLTRLSLPKGYCVQKNSDFSRWVISTGGRGKEVYKALEKADIFAEMYDFDRVVFIVTPFNVDSLDRIVEVLKGDITHPKKDNTDKYLSLIGKVALSDIGLFPPCVPIIKKGEIIEQDKLWRVLDSIEKAYGLET